MLDVGNRFSIPLEHVNDTEFHLTGTNSSQLLLFLLVILLRLLVPFVQGCQQLPHFRMMLRQFLQNLIATPLFVQLFDFFGSGAEDFGDGGVASLDGFLGCFRIILAEDRLRYGLPDCFRGLDRLSSVT